MKYIRDLRPGEAVSDIYLCKTRNPATTKNGKAYENLILQDKTGTIDAKIWEPDSPGIDDFAPLDYVQIQGEVTSFNGASQITVRRARKCREGEYDQAEYLPVSRYDNDKMFESLKKRIEAVQDPHLHALLVSVFLEDEDFQKIFRTSSAAKSVHHGYIGGLMEHTLSVVRFCAFLADAYPILDRDLLMTAALCHDIGKTRELSAFPENDYTDDGQFLGHIVIGTSMLEQKIAGIEGFPPLLKNKLLHCILAHHGEYEFGSPKKPAIPEAFALHMADNTDAKLETFAEMADGMQKPGWQGFQRLFDSHVYLDARPGDDRA